MPEIRYPDGAGTPFVPGQPAPPPHAGARREAAAEKPVAPEDAPWQTTVVRVSTLIAVWLGY
jgi:hypothetical protein